MQLPNLRKILFIAAGIVCLALGTIGAFLPVLPTVVFYLLAAAAFARSSERLYAWIMNHRFIGPLIRDYRRYRAVPARSKVIALVFLWLTIGSSAVFAVESWWLRALLALIAVGVTAHILSLRTLTKGMRAENRESRIENRELTIENQELRVEN
jgi:uncharacterized membrane protein YbaN (DUF454 family)